MIVRVRGLVSLILAATTVLAGCHLIGRRGEIERWSGLVSDLRLQWSAEPGIDILTGAAVPVRAYTESSWLAHYMGNLDYAYPGFTRAVPPNAPEDSPDIGARSRRPSLDRPLGKALIGNDRYHILSLTQSGRNVTATLCNYRYAVAMQEDNDTFKSVQSGTGESRGIYTERVTLVAPGDESDPLPPQSGPQPAPSSDVFGGWQIVGFLSSFSTIRPGFTDQWPTHEADVATCVDKAPDPPERRAFLVEGEHPRSDFPTSPASPGWPESQRE
jgi:hypothetical protein